MPGRVVEPGEFLVPEFLVKLRRLERKRVDPCGMTAESKRMLLGITDQPPADAAAPQVAMHPEQHRKQPSGVAMADQTGADRAGLAAHEDPEIGIAGIAQETGVVFAEPFVDELP